MTDHDDPINEAGEATRRPVRAARSKVLKGARIAFNQASSAIPCTIRNISDSGAQLVVEGSWLIPEQFTLYVEVDGFKVECERVRQKGGECGVRFTGEKIRTGSKRQQVLTPETGRGDERAPPPPPDQRPPEVTFAAPFPGGSGRHGFGRRAR